MASCFGAAADAIEKGRLDILKLLVEADNKSPRPHPHPRLLERECGYADWTDLRRWLGQVDGEEEPEVAKAQPRKGRGKSGGMDWSGG